MPTPRNPHERMALWNAKDDGSLYKREPTKEEITASIRRTLERTLQFVRIATDWHFDVVELDNVETDAYVFAEEIEAAIKELDKL